MMWLTTTGSSCWPSDLGIEAADVDRRDPAELVDVLLVTSERGEWRIWSNVPP